MRLIQILVWLLISLPVFAWQVTLQPNNPNQILVNNDRNLHDVLVYLVWVDLDINHSFVSWTSSQQWKTGLQPVFDTPVNLNVFESYPIIFEKPACPDDHRCFLAFVATLPEQDPLDKKFWQAQSFLPLNLLAGCERFAGQELFLSCDNNANRVYAMDIVSEPDMALAPEAVETEKPDIFKLFGDKLLYANGQAKRFQVIDISDLSKPRLEGWTALFGNPQELYVLGDYYILLQSNLRETHLTVLRQGTLTLVQELTLSGQFIESRRRNDMIYTVTQNISEGFNKCINCDAQEENTTTIQVLKINPDTGQLEVLDTTEVAGYSPITAIFPNHLVIANQDWQTTKIQIFDLSQTEPLVALPTLNVPGRVPSEFHLNILEQHFRVVYGPENRQDGSTLAIYDLPQMSLIGKVDKIAPGEDLFATRFIDDRAFVVTFERTDPLWVIDLSNPIAPQILGELHVPGWSEKLFFHEDRLFAVGIDDQPLENEENRWVRRVALSLFDVKDPTQPALLNRFTPLVGNYTWSLALDDERALLLDWDNAFAALPIESENGSHLQIVSMETDIIEDAGRLDRPVPIQRTLSLDANVLAALGDQALFTIRWGQGEPEILGELELAKNLTWLEKQDDNLWAAARGNNGYQRFYRYSTKDVKTSAQSWALPKGYMGLEMDGNLAVFYNYNPLTVQVLNVTTGQLNPTQLLENTKEQWYNQALVHDGWFYVVEQQPIQTNEMYEKNLLQIQWKLNRWTLEGKKAPSYSIPGNPLGFTATGKLITQESSNDGKLRLNILTPGAEHARLLDSHELPCQAYSQVFLVDKAVYVNCAQSHLGYEENTQLLKLNPEQTLVIGDTIYDMECAKKVGCQHLLFNNKNESDIDLKIIKNLADIKEVINK